MEKQNTQCENISLELDGEIYYGYRRITDDIIPRQTIYFRYESIQDNFVYESWKFKNPKKMMDIRAKELLRKLVFKYLEESN